MAKNLSDYLSLPYTKSVRKDLRDDIFVARVVEIPGCTAHGDTEEDALANLRDNIATWIEDALESGDPVPVPVTNPDLPSGKWLQRVPRSIHKKLIDLAKLEETSLNQLVATILAEALGERSSRRASQVISQIDAFSGICEEPKVPVTVHYLTPSITFPNAFGRGGRRSMLEESALTESFMQMLSSSTPTHQEIRAGASAKNQEKHFAYQA